jgi:hypothetical protein
MVMAMAPCLNLDDQIGVLLRSTELPLPGIIMEYGFHCKQASKGPMAVAGRHGDHAFYGPKLHLPPLSGSFPS